MPHYKDGTPANVGDLVKGKPYNTDREIVGEVIQITEGTDTCNLIVAFAEPVVIGCDLGEFSRKTGIFMPGLIGRVAGGRVEQGQAYGVEWMVVVPRHDYGETRSFIKIG